MKIVNKVKKFQEGGAMPAGDPNAMPPQEAAPADPMTQLLQVAAQALQTQNCEAAMAVCQALLQLAQGGPAGPEAAPQEEPTFAKRGAKLVRVR
jgi:hypothetical protein